jgi:hypothetical protein
MAIRSGGRSRAEQSAHGLVNGTEPLSCPRYSAPAGILPITRGRNAQGVPLARSKNRYLRDGESNAGLPVHGPPFMKANPVAVLRRTLTVPAHARRRACVVGCVKTQDSRRIDRRTRFSTRHGAAPRTGISVESGRLTHPPTLTMWVRWAPAPTADRESEIHPSRQGMTGPARRLQRQRPTGGTMDVLAAVAATKL